MDGFVPFASPWWVNLLILVPVAAWFGWHHAGLDLSRRQLTFAALFGIGFGFVEAAVVVYLRAAVGLLPGYRGTLAEVRRLAPEAYRQSQAISEFPQSLLLVELFREAATILMLVAVALLAARRWRERSAVFLWVFAIWDIIYYAGLWATIGWPPSLLAPDVLFLIPAPWISQVWYPLLVSSLTLAAVLLARRKEGKPS